MLIGACLEALVGIGHESSLGAIRRRFPDLAVVPDFLLASCLKAIGALWDRPESSLKWRICCLCAALTFARRFLVRSSPYIRAARRPIPATDLAAGFTCGG